MKPLQNIFILEGMRVDDAPQVSLSQLKCEICKRQVESYPARIKLLRKLTDRRNPADYVWFARKFFENLCFSLKTSNSVGSIWCESKKGIVKLKCHVLISDFVICLEQDGEMPVPSCRS